MIDLRFDRVSKCYSVREEESTIKNPLLRKWQSLRHGAKEFWAVRDVSFEVKRGEALGIIGHNGAGKSTILKLLSNITTPTSGEITINGRLAALIEVGSGFHPELTGRENVYLSGSILGMKRREIKSKLDSIVEFAGVQKFIDTPVKRYSSGMFVRLGFAIAAHLEPDILLLDEVLAVGDAAFQAKCLKRVKEMERAGTTIVFISHDLHAVEQLCTRALLMERGQVAATGTPHEVIKCYTRAAFAEGVHLNDGLCFNNPSPDQRLPFEVEKVELLDRNGRVKHELRTGDYVRFKVTWRAEELLEYGGVELGIHTLHGLPLLQCATRPITTTDVTFYPGRNTIELELQEFPFAAGEYALLVGLTIPNVEWLCQHPRFALLTVEEADVFKSGKPVRTENSMLVAAHRWIVPAEQQVVVEESEYQEVTL